MAKHRFGLLTLLLAITPGAGQDVPEACQKYMSALIPRRDQPSPQQAKVMANCSAMNLYYGIGGPADPRKARLCAYAEMAREKHADDYF